MLCNYLNILMLENFMCFFNSCQYLCSNSDFQLVSILVGALLLLAVIVYFCCWNNCTFVQLTIFVYFYQYWCTSTAVSNLKQLPVVVVILPLSVTCFIFLLLSMM